MDENNTKDINSKMQTLSEIFGEFYKVDFYQREYVWEPKQLADLINDLSTEFLNNYNEGDDTPKTKLYDPYFMGEIIISQKNGTNFIVDGQQRLTTFTLLFIYLYNTFRLTKSKTTLVNLIKYDDCGDTQYHIGVDERKQCLDGLLDNGEYKPTDNDPPSVRNIVDIYGSIPDYWDSKINEDNADNFVYWLTNRVMFSKVWTSDDDLAYVIFETMNDRGLSLTPVEMLRSYLLANISTNRNEGMEEFDESVAMVRALGSKTDMEFFKVYFKACLAEDMSQYKNAKSDFVRINNGFHRWVRDRGKSLLGLNGSNDFMEFIKHIRYYAGIYSKIHGIIDNKDYRKHLYVVVNSDYGFTMQYPFILSAINYKDDETIVEKKIQMVSKYLTIALSSKVWRQNTIAQSYVENDLYTACKGARNRDVDGLRTFLEGDPLGSTDFSGTPVLNQQNGNKIKILLSYITAIVGRESDEPEYPAEDRHLEIEHIWANHPEQHPELTLELFNMTRNSIGDLLVLPKSFNASYKDLPYVEKLPYYFSQNILAKSLNGQKYGHNPGFQKFINESKLPFRHYEE
ncbi:MAG: DUF262 domain-containing protein, partial [archaeon]|nr:DUF262 domain-containing protein [archaeon]